MEALQYSAMAVLTVAAVPVALALRRRPAAATGVGLASWLVLAAYVPIELAVMRATTAAYDPMRQAVSVLGVTVCDPEPLPEVGDVVCSPLHLPMNWTFTLSGIAIAIGAITLRRRLPDGPRVTAAMWTLAVAGLSYASSGIIPADVDLFWHTVLAIPGMVVQIPAWIIMAVALARTSRPLAAWTGLAATVHVAGLVGFAASFVADVPGGLFQRLMVWAILIWAPVFAAPLARAGSRFRIESHGI
ncbi:DUF998 domain-containing protein [Glycomyces tarimensis]